MLTLGGAGVEFRGPDLAANGVIIRISEDASRLPPLRKSEAFLSKGGPLPEGFKLYITLRRDIHMIAGLPGNASAAILPDDYEYLADGDVIRLQPARKSVRALYRRKSLQNFFLLTERCNNYCLMCSQPPKQVDDSWIVDEIMTAIPLMDPSMRELGFTGGEPTLLGDDLIRILRTAKNYLPTTGMHILSNGRKFADTEFTAKYAAIDHPDMMVGIPVYSDLSHVHDYVVQADGAFDETIRGILNLKRFKQKVEVRVVIHKQTYKRLPQLAEFLIRNLTFVDHIALMGLEMTGFTKANLEDLWIDPIDYQAELYEAASLLNNFGMNTSIYNLQLCLLDKRLWHLARRSISDWKNEFMPECDGCTKKNECAGFFSSAKLRYSGHIHAFGN